MSNNLIKPDDMRVGAGAAGCMPVNRLSVDPLVRVLLVEVGRPTIDSGAEPRRASLERFSRE